MTQIKNALDPGIAGLLSAPEDGLFSPIEEGAAPFSGRIAVVDSGAGGLSVLSTLLRAIPEASFLYFGDTAYAPYGEKEEEWIRARTHAIARMLRALGASEIVLACNTMTAAAARSLRETDPAFPVIGMEPALKSAADAGCKEVLVLATEVTLRLAKYHVLEEKWGAQTNVHSVPCPGLAGRIEQGNWDAPDLTEMLHSLIGEWSGRVDGVVLGCTHYPFVKDRIRDILGNVLFFDGRDGTARETKRRAEAAGILTKENGPEPRVILLSSDHREETYARYETLLCKEAAE